MPRLSLTRRFLRRITFLDVKFINNHYGLQPRKSKLEMIGQIIPMVGTNLQTLISHAGPYSLAEWNKTIVEFGGNPRKSFDLAADEIEACLDPVYDVLDGDTTITELRGDKLAVRTLADKLGVDRAEFSVTLEDTHGLTLLSTFVSRIRENQNQQKVNTTSKAVSMRVASTRVKAAAVEGLKLSWMKDYFSGAEHISIAAGFYDKDFILNLLGKHQSAQDIRLLFNGLGGHRLVAQRIELQELIQELKLSIPRKTPNIDVRLYFAPGMFHSKLFLISQGSSISALVGSANATTAALKRNEEILIPLENAAALNDYFNSAWDEGKSLADLDLKANSLVSFFRTGILYFKPVTTLAITINPVRMLLNLMSDDERNLLGGKSLPYAEQETGIGSFSLKFAIQNEKIGEDADDSTDEENENEVEKQRQRASIVPWSIETCFGYWVPSALDAAWQENLQAAGALKEQKWITFLEQLDAISDEELLGKYQEYLDAIQLELKVIPKLPEYLAKLKQNPFDTSIFSKFFAQVVLYLRDDNRRVRLTQPFIKGEVPEIWDDIQAYTSFRTSFFDHLNQVAHSKKVRPPKVPSKILNKLDTEQAQSGDELEAEFASYLEYTGWTDSEWLD